jgi:hypothetical protein
MMLIEVAALAVESQAARCSHATRSGAVVCHGADAQAALPGQFWLAQQARLVPAKTRTPGLRLGLRGLVQLKLGLGLRLAESSESARESK